MTNKCSWIARNVKFTDTQFIFFEQLKWSSNCQMESVGPNTDLCQVCLWLACCGLRGVVKEFNKAKMLGHPEEVLYCHSQVWKLWRCCRYSELLKIPQSPLCKCWVRADFIALKLIFKWKMCRYLQWLLYNNSLKYIVHISYVFFHVVNWIVSPPPKIHMLKPWFLMQLYLKIEPLSR